MKPEQFLKLIKVLWTILYPTIEKHVTDSKNPYDNLILDILDKIIMKGNI